MGQDIVAEMAIQIDRRANLVEVDVGANTGDLEGAIAARVDAGGFIVVPKKSGHGLFLC
jgi:hypothetical protein